MLLKSMLIVLLLALANAGEYTDRFFTLYQQIVDPNNGYYSKDGVPYHSRENMLVETVDHGHETDSEAVSYNVWLHAMYGGLTGDFQPFNNAWNVIENNFIPQTQYNMDKYTPQIPVRNADPTFSIGIDPIFDELKQAYNETNVYQLHWLVDTDNNYGFGNAQGQCEAGPSASGASFIQNGQGWIWQNVPYPTCDNFKYGGKTGFQYTGGEPSWHYNSAPDADARVVQAGYWASQWAQRLGKIDDVQDTLGKVAKLGDFLRYSFFDAAYKQVGNCIGSGCPAGKAKESAHYLISWFVGWGGLINSENVYSWRTGSSETIIGYQNPVAAYALVNDPYLRPKGATAAQDWQTSLSRQVELYEWMQTPEGCLAGGVTNSWKNVYGEPPSDVRAYTFHGMFYENEPGLDDGTSDWFGMWTWTMDRLAQYYYITGDATAYKVLQKWTVWLYAHMSVDADSYSVPVSVSWSGSLPTNTKMTILESGTSFYGIGSSIARTLTYYAAKSGDAVAKNTAKQLLDVIWTKHKDNLGMYARSTLTPFSNAKSLVYLPVQGWSGTYPNGVVVSASSTYLDIRPFLKNDENWQQLENYLNGGTAPVVDYHRFWEQADVALALGAYGMLFNE